jgi:ELWxxDGT repeat protein
MSGFTIEPLESRRVLSAHLINATGSDGPRDPHDFVVFKKAMYFVASDAEHGAELWRSDGTPQGTRLLHDILPGSESSLISDLTVVGERLYFSARSSARPDANVVLFSSDGSLGSAKPVLDTMWSETIHDPDHLTDAGSGVLYFANPDGVWHTTDSLGTSARRLNLTVPPIHDIAAIGSSVYFSFTNQLWRTDGTDAGTTQVFKSATSLSTASLTPVGERLFFTADDLYVTDGTRNATLRLHGPIADNLTPLGGSLIFTSGDGLYVSDGTLPGTKLIRQIEAPPLPGGSNFVSFSNFTPVGKRLAFAVSFSSGPGGIWFTDGTSRGTYRVATLSRQQPVRFVGGRNTLFALTTTRTSGGVSTGSRLTINRSLWRSDTTAAGTRIVDEYVIRDRFDHAAFQMAGFDGALFYPASDAQRGSGLYRFDPATSSIVGNSFLDGEPNVAANGIKDGFDVGLPGYRVFLDADGDGKYHKGERTTRTNASGDFRFDDLPAGTYSVRQVPIGAMTTKPARTIKLTGGDRAVVFFGNANDARNNLPARTLTGSVFSDINGDGKQGTGESGLSGFRVFLDLNANHRLDRTEPQTRTDSTGQYHFSGLRIGSVRVLQTQVPSHIPINKLEHPARVTPAGAPVLAFANQPRPVLRGVIFHDLNANRVRDPGEPPVRGARFIAYTVTERRSNFITTGASGEYTVYGASGIVTPDVDYPGYRQTNPRPSFELHGGDDIRYDIGLSDTAVVSGYVWENHYVPEKSAMAYDLPAAGARVWVDIDENGSFDAAEPSTLTTSNGRYVLAVFPGAHTIRASLPMGAALDGSHTLTFVSAGQKKANFIFARSARIFGLVGDAAADGTAPISNVLVFIDKNDNGVLDSTEPATRTDSSGLFSFDAVPPQPHDLLTVLSGWEALVGSNNHVQPAPGETLVPELLMRRIA